MLPLPFTQCLWLQRACGYSQDGRQTFRSDGARAESQRKRKRTQCGQPQWDLLRGDPGGASADCCSLAEPTSRAGGGQRGIQRATEAMEAALRWSAASANCHSGSSVCALACCCTVAESSDGGCRKPLKKKIHA